MTLRPSAAPQPVPLSSPPASSLLDGPDPQSDSLRAASPTVARFLATADTDPLFESTATSALVAELVDFAAACRLDFATSLVAESASVSVCPPSVGGECALGTDVLEDRQEEIECFAASVPHLVSMLLAPEGDPDALDIPTPRSYAEAIEGPYSSQWQAAMDAEMASWKSTGTYIDEVPPPGANIVSGMWIFRVKRPPGSPPAFKACYVACGFSSLHEEIWLRRPPGFTGSFPPGTHWSLRRPVYGLRQAPREWNSMLRTTLAALGFAPSTADPSLFLRIDATLPPFFVLVYVDDLVFATADTEALGHEKSELQKRHTCTDLAPPSDESIEPSGPYPELVGCLMYLMTCTRPDLAYPLSLLARYVAPGRHRKVHWDAAKRVLRYLCSTSGMGLVIGGRARVVLTGHADTSWELCWLTYLLTDLGEAPRSPLVLYVDNKAMLALCQEHRLEHRTKHTALRYFLARELQQRGQLRLAYVASQANTADVFTKALQPCDHQRFCTVLDLWKQSVKEEYDCLLENESWEFCELPPGKKAISSKLNFKHKYGPDGELTRYKSRLVAKVFQQTKGKDFDEIFAPVGKGTTLRVMLGTAANRGWRIKQMDITTDFLNGIILEELYMLQLEGLDDGSGRVCRIKKAIYGLKQAPRAWYHKSEETLLAGGFKKSKCDHSLFLLQEKEQFLMLLVYVDDILLFSLSSAMIERVEEMLEMQFKCSKMGDVKYYLGMHVERDLDKGGLRLHQRKYCEVLSSGFTVEPCAEKEVVGESLYPSHEQLEAAKRLVRYVSATAFVGLEYSAVRQRQQRGAPNLGKGEMLLNCYTDASFNSVKADGTSIGGYVCLFGGGAVS
ncbi:unnamed protein product [Closterium sp. NIES-54]